MYPSSVLSTSGWEAKGSQIAILLPGARCPAGDCKTVSNWLFFRPPRRPEGGVYPISEMWLVMYPNSVLSTSGWEQKGRKLPPFRWQGWQVQQGLAALALRAVAKQ